MLCYASLPEDSAYAVSNVGDIINKTSGKVLKKQSTGRIRAGFKEERQCEYYKCTLRKGKRITVHRTVAKAFVPNPNQHRYVDHIDRDTSNNSASNLRWVASRLSSMNKTKTRTLNRRITSRYKGVGSQKLCDGRLRWYCYFRGKSWMFYSEEEAARHYNKVAIEYEPNSSINVFD